jgi:Virulence factor BrkB
MNRIYEIGEGRPVWKLRPAMFVVTLVLVVLAAVAILALIVSGPLTQALGSALGLGPAAVLAWRIVKWPILLIVVLVIVATLYYATPNVKQTKFRWLSVGALVAIIIWALLSVAFGFYEANFSSYNKTYGALAGVIVFLSWLWITNLALLLGAELDAELERGRELQSGVAAEDTIQLPARDTRNIDKAETKHAADAQRGRELRSQARDDDGTKPTGVNGTRNDKPPHPAVTTTINRPGSHSWRNRKNPASPRGSFTVRSASPARWLADSWLASSSSKYGDAPHPVTGPTRLQRSKASTALRRSLLLPPPRGPSTRLSRPSSTVAVPGFSNDGLGNGLVAEAIPHG